MLRRLFWLALVALALLLLLGLMAAQAETPPPPLSALAPQAVSLPPDTRATAGEAERISPLPLTVCYFPLYHAGSQPLPEAPEATAAYYRRCFLAFHYSDRAG